MTDKRAAIFCSASDDIDPKYNEAARQVVRALSLYGYGIVSGGTIKGTMGVVCDEADRCGTECIAILPRFMKGLEYPRVTKLIWTDTMAERKEAMRADTWISIALPGGIGTLDELIETLVLVKLKRYPGRILVLNLDGFYNPLKSLLDHYVKTSMMSSQDRSLISFPSTIEELTQLL